MGVLPQNRHRRLPRCTDPALQLPRSHAFFEPVVELHASNLGAFGPIRRHQEFSEEVGDDPNAVAAWREIPTQIEVPINLSRCGAMVCHQEIPDPLLQFGSVGGMVRDIGEDTEHQEFFHRPGF